jgi:chemotaxis protein methyltransferase CheR
VGDSKIYVSAGLPEEEQFQALQGKIFNEHGLDCRRYKSNYLKRRIQARLRAVSAATYADYAVYLDKTPDEYRLLQDKITVNVTEFFRDGSVWKYFYDTLLPQWWEKTSKDWQGRDAAMQPKLRIWSAGCSTGEEPYSLAILCQRFFEIQGIKAPVSILATDLDEVCLAYAKKGRYAEEVLQAIDPLNRLGFEKDSEEIIRVKQACREMVSFRRLNLISDEMPRGMHFIFCRNVMIYFTREEHTRLFGSFHRALAQDGIMVIGKTETLMGESRELFSGLSAKERVFLKVEPARG